MRPLRLEARVPRAPAPRLLSSLPSHFRHSLVQSVVVQDVTMKLHAPVSVRAPLTELEHDVMHVVWDVGPSAVEAVHRVVSAKRSLRESTTRTILRRLEKKGYLIHTTEGRAYIYRAAEPRQSLAARAVRQIIDRFCRGSVEDLVTGMVDAELLNRDEIETLRLVVRDQGRRLKSGTQKE